MRPIPPKIRRVLTLAGLWDADAICLPCGCRRGCQAEHALYETPDGRQGMGAAQLNEVWAIIPACPTCNTDGPKRLNAYCALLVGERMGALSAAQEKYLKTLKYQFKGRGYDAVRRRVGFWCETLGRAGK